MGKRGKQPYRPIVKETISLKFGERISIEQAGEYLTKHYPHIPFEIVGKNKRLKSLDAGYMLYFSKHQQLLQIKILTKSSVLQSSVPF